MLKINRKLTLFVAVVLFGIMMLFLGLSLMDFSFKSSVLSKKQTYEFLGIYHSIDIDASEIDAHIEIKQSSTGVIEYFEQDGVEIRANIVNDKFSIAQTDTRKWYDKIGLKQEKEQHITINLPKQDYSSIKIKTKDKDIIVNSDFSSKIIKLTSVSGDITCFSSAEEAIHVTNERGDLLLNATDFGDINIKTESGDVEVIDTTAEKININSTEGDVKIQNSKSNKDLIITTRSGDVEFLSSNAKEIKITTVNGDVFGKIVGAKEFIVDGNKKKINIPESIKGGDKFYITTKRGEVKLRVY